MREKPRVLEALEDVQQEKKNQERRLRILQPKLQDLQRHESDILDDLNKEKEEQVRLKREIALMNGRLEDAENRITHMKQIHDQQNKKIREIDEEKDTLTKENRKWHYDISRDFRYMKDTKNLIRQVEINGIDAARQNLNQRIKVAKRSRQLKPILERSDADKMKNVVTEGLSKLRKINSISDLDQSVSRPLNISKSFDALTDQRCSSDRLKRIPTISRSQNMLPFN